MDTPEAPAVQGPDATRPVVVDYTGDWPARAVSLIATVRVLGIADSDGSDSGGAPARQHRYPAGQARE